MFASAINIEGFVLGNSGVIVRITFLSPAIGGAAGSINQGDLFLSAPLPKFLGVIGVHLPHINFIMVARVGAGAQVNDSSHVAQFGQFLEKLFAVDKRQVFQALHAAPGFCEFGLIDQDQVFLSFR